ncbi:phage tail fiber protein [Paenibacillus sp. y28]|uniref:phage tail fiber protein n=1 Tax=Paenibacillus sp. y28 TaxID=3129110 RepID=UPI003015A0EE
MAEVLLSKSNYFKTATLNAALRGQSFTAPSTVYIALYTSNPTAADTGQEVSGGAYARQPVTFSAPTAANDLASTSNTADVNFAVATADWGTITHIGLRSAATGGNLLYHGAVTSPRTILANDRARFLAGSIKVDEG